MPEDELYTTGLDYLIELKRQHEVLAARLAEAEAELKFFRNAFPNAARNWQKVTAAPVKDAPCICAEIFTAGVVNPDCPQHGSMTD